MTNKKAISAETFITRINALKGTSVLSPETDNAFRIKSAYLSDGDICLEKVGDDNDIVIIKKDIVRGFIECGDEFFIWTQREGYYDGNQNLLQWDFNKTIEIDDFLKYVKQSEKFVVEMADKNKYDLYFAFDDCENIKTDDDKGITQVTFISNGSGYYDNSFDISLNHEKCVIKLASKNWGYYESQIGFIIKFSDKSRPQITLDMKKSGGWIE